MRRMNGALVKVDSFRDFVLEQLGAVGGVSCRSMFGGYGLYREKLFFGIIFKGRIYFKVSDESRPHYAAAGKKPFKPYAGKTMTSFYEVPEDVLESTPKIAEWAETAVRAASVAK